METVTAKTVRAEGSGRPYGCIEIVNRAGKVLHQLPVREGVVHIGRGYDNDVVVDDPYVAPRHLILWWDGDVLQVRSDDADADGLPAALACGEQLRIGRSLLRFRSACFPLAPTRSESEGSGSPSTLLGSPLWQAGALLLCALVLIADDYLGTASKYMPMKGITELIIVLMAVFLWAALWSFASRIVIHQWNFWRHTTIAFLALAVLNMLQAAGGYIAFALNLDALATPGGMAAKFLVAAAALFLHLHCATLLKTRRLLIVSGSLATILVSLPLLFSLAERDFSSRPKYEMTFKTPAAKIVGSRDSATFFAKAEELFGEVDEEIAVAKEKEAN